MRMTLLVGPIASGKSAFAAERAAQGAFIVNDDSLVCSVHGGKYDLYDPACKAVYTALEMDIILAAANLGRDVVIDRGCRNRATRARFSSLGRSLGFSVDYKPFPFDAPETHASRRFMSDSRGLTYEKWLQVAREHHDTFEPVSVAEGLTLCGD